MGSWRSGGIFSRRLDFSLDLTRGLGLSTEERPGVETTHREPPPPALPSLGRIPQLLWPACQSGVWNFLSWMPVKTRWIIPNSLDKRLLGAGCAAGFYQAFVSITMCKEGPSFMLALVAAWERNASLKRATHEGGEAPWWAGGGMGRGRPPGPFC